MLLKTIKKSIFNPQSSRCFFNNFFTKNNTKERRLVDNSFGKYEIVTLWNVSKMHDVPSHIQKPSWYKAWTSEKLPDEIEIKNDIQIEKMRQSCKLAKKILNSVELLIEPGVTTDFIDEQIHKLIISYGAYPSPLNYLGYPKSICTSINNVACHGIPDDRPLVEGDTLNVDITVFLNGYHGDCSDMFCVGQVDSKAKQLIQVTRECLDIGINVCKPDEQFCNIGNAIEEHANKNGFSVIPVFCGHGIGSYFHGQPDIYHVGNDLPGVMKAGMVFTIEPVLSQGGTDVKVLEDGWSAVTTDDSRTAQVEHTILVTNHGCEILTC
ncbi:hypothetical protein HCN44_006375 [Aphidius gifuensis]|uniref:Methionine aminopeptidase n=1 Tax=Aphidius gifuensis TaxID=684658 RepID=A0A834XTR1_APHGI|nr:methionine aminopeptidase 1D, mitochondrial [Aphidius gifuensis]KAF7993315.1 hypothetical protein HCN44_006375 [Aphidius gifuensis]